MTPTTLPPGPDSPRGPHPWPRSALLDLREVRALVAASGLPLVVDGLLAGGEVGAVRVRDADGRPGVLGLHVGDEHEIRGHLAVAEAARARGVPAPAVRCVRAVGDTVLVAVELLPGTAVRRLTHALLDQALAALDLHAGALAGREDVATVPLHLLDDGPGFCLHGPLRAGGRRAARLEAWVREVGSGAPPELPGTDAVHVDFHQLNLLATDGRLTGVVDWDGAGRGDGTLDLVTLRFGARGGEADPGVGERVHEQLAARRADVVRWCWAHMALRTVDWALRHHGHEDVERRLDLAERPPGPGRAPA